MYAGCVAGAIDINGYLLIVKEAGFRNVVIQKEKKISIPRETLEQYLDKTELAKYGDGEIGIYSITLKGEKTVEKTCCDSSCCS
jgi:hypothetical protein